MRRWDIWKTLQAGAAVLVLVLVLTSPRFWDDPASPAAVSAVFFGPLVAAGAVFAVSHIVELIAADVRLWRSKRRHQSAEPGLIEVLPRDRPAALIEEGGRDADEIIVPPAHRKSLEQRRRRRIGDDPGKLR